MKKASQRIGLIVVMIVFFLIGGCGTAKNSTTPVQVEGKQTIPVATPRQEATEEIQKRSQLLKNIEQQQKQLQSELEKNDHKARVDEEYLKERDKKSKDRNWDMTIALAEDYLRKYPEIEENYLDVEATLIASLSHKGEWKILINFIDASARMNKLHFRDNRKAYALRMKASALSNLERSEEAKKLYNEVITEYASAERDVSISKDELKAMELLEKEKSTLGYRFDEAYSYIKYNPPEKSLTGLGKVKFSSSVRDVSKLLPKARFDLHGSGECTYTNLLYACITWEENFYGYSAKVTVQFSSANTIDRIAILFGLENTDVIRCLGFRTSVIPELIKKYGRPYMDPKETLKMTWSLNGGIIEYSDVCSAGELFFSIIVLKPSSVL